MMLYIKLMKEACQLSRCVQAQRIIQEALDGSKDSEQVEKKKEEKKSIYSMLYDFIYA